LFVVDVDAPELLRASSKAGVDVGLVTSTIEIETQDAVLAQGPDPKCIQARPNRIVILARDTFHCIRRVDETAGDRARASISGFFSSTVR
jgi:hypothetical protein